MYDYTVLDVEEIVVAYHLLMQQQKEFLKVEYADDLLTRRHAVEKMQNRIRKYKEVTNEEVRKQLNGRGANLDMLEERCKQLILESSETIRSNVI